jgi:hypothetical protein
MKCVLLGKVALALDYDLPFIPLHCHFIALTSSPQIISL